MDNNSEVPIRDLGSFSTFPNICEEEIAGHHTDRWQNQAMYVGLHFPGQRRHKKRHHRRKEDKDDDKEKPSEESSKAPKEGSSEKKSITSTPPSTHVQLLLGECDEDDEEHQSHDIFCELGELRSGGEGVEWKETARWVKFEEDVEEGGERWSKPHVATLSLHSLFELRKGIMSGSVMLDLDAANMLTITDLVLDNMVAQKQLDPDHREHVQDLLLSRHRHLYQQKAEQKGLPLIRSLADIGRKNSQRVIEGAAGAEPGSKTGLSTGNLGNQSMSNMKKASYRDLPDATSDDSTGQKYNEHFAKKIPAGAEASNILVGESELLTGPIVGFIRLAKGVMLGDLTEVPVPTRFLFLLLGPKGNQKRYHEIGRSIATLMSDEVFHEVAYKARSRDDLLAGIDEFLDQVTVLPPGEWDPSIRIEPPKSVPSQEARKIAQVPSSNNVPNGNAVVEEEEPEEHTDPTLKRTGRLFGGLVLDIKRKLPWYLSDFTDALHVQSVAAIFFMYFACLTPIVTFGLLLGQATGNNMAAMESLVSGAVAGVSYHLFAGQPLTIIGSTGPVLVFESIVYKFCQSYRFNYLALRFWIGMWMSFALMMMVAFDLSSLVRFITRFTEESFAMLIALIFIYEAFTKMYEILTDNAVDRHPDILKDYNCTCIEKINKTETEMFKCGSQSNSTIYWPNVTLDDCTDMCGEKFGSGCDTPHYVHNVFFFSCLLFFGTFALSMGLKSFRNTRFFPNRVRSLISDFAVFTSIMLMVLVDFLVGIQTPKLEVPQNFRPTRDDRGWIVNPFVNPWYTIPLTIFPAMLATILIFMDQQITTVIINRKEHKLKKGCGYHLDMLVITVQQAACSLLGSPWFVAATVLSINHVRSLTIETESSAPGERPKFLGVRENRATGVIIFALVGLSVKMAPLLMFIPKPVLFGVFLFMGFSTLKGIQMVQRVLIMFMPVKYQPDYVFLRHVPLYRVHLFTVIQIICLAALCVIKEIKSISIVFPLMVLAMCFVRKALDWLFTQHELKWLDDIMPDQHKKEKEEKRKQREKEQQALQAPEAVEGTVNIPLKEGKTVSLPVKGITYDPETHQVNISEEMSKTAIWKHLANDDSQSSLQGMELKQRKAKSETDNGGSKKEAVKFRIDDDETECLMKAPEIIIDPPSKMGSPSNSMEGLSQSANRA